jgi:pyruvate dehydrogenase (quinone)
MASNAAELIIESLITAGVKRIYGIPGDSLNGITEAIRKHKEFEWIHVRHEEVAGFAAGAEAHLSGSLAVCAGSCGPGNLHLINGLYDCHRSRVPVLAIAAQVPSAELGSAYFQETRPEQLFRDCSHYCEMATDPNQVPRILGIAMRNAIAKRGVSVLVAPGDVLLGSCSEPMHPVGFTKYPPIVSPDPKDLARAADLLNAARKVTILGGAGCEGSHADLLAIASRLQAPIVHALRGKEFIEYDNSFDVGMTGLIGFSSGYYAMMDCEALLMLGTDFPYQQFFPEHAKIIQVDLRGEQIGRRTRVELGLIGDVKDTINALLPMLEQKSEDKHLRASLDHYRSARQELDELAVGEPGHTPIHPQYVAKVMDELADDDAVFTCDVGTPSIWAARYLRMNGKRRLLGSFTHGSMANALPQAIGAQALDRKRQVVTLSGDGGLAMLLGDILTLPQMNLPVKIVVFNNGALGFVELEMKAVGLVEFGTELKNPNFAEVARAAGLFGVRVEKPEDLAGALREALRYDGPALVDVVVDRQELSMPPHITVGQLTGFALYMAKTVLSGRGDKIVNLAKTTLFR